MSVFDRIEMHVIDMPAQIAFVANQMFPVTALPDAAFASFKTLCGSSFLHGQAT